MKTYITNRLLMMLITLVGMSVLIFILLRLAPGNITDILFDSAGYVDEADKALIEAELGLDKPYVVQYVTWITDLMRGELGKSFRLEIPAIDVIGPRVPVTLELASLAIFFAILFGVPTGVISAVRQDTKIDYVLRVISLSGLSMPSFWLALVIILTMITTLGISPLYVAPPDGFWDHLRLFLIPALAVGFRSSALIMRLTRSSMLEVMRQDYIRTAEAKGQNRRVINYHHALKNAILPVITVIGIEFAFLIGGLVITETVFNIPGVARFLVQAILWRDYPIVQNLVMMIAVIVVMANFIVDLLYIYLDPRIQYS